ncbi:MAG: hypothetical protein JWN41_721 [Thermoleophilia bacterium]|nr:hypothetical protein [Thermoleophilia bacterium]
MTISGFRMVLAPVLGLTAGLNTRTAIKEFDKGETQKGVGSSLLAAGDATAAIAQFKSGGVGAALVGVGLLTALTGLAVKWSSD